MWAQSDGSTTWPIATAVSALNGSKNANPALVEQLECARHSSSEQIRFIIDEAFQVSRGRWEIAGGTRSPLFSGRSFNVKVASKSAR